MAVDFATTPAPAVGKPRVLFNAPLTDAFDVAPDGRFLVARPVDARPLSEINLVQNWFDELKAKAGPRIPNP